MSQIIHKHAFACILCGHETLKYDDVILSKSYIYQIVYVLLTVILYRSSYNGFTDTGVDDQVEIFFNTRRFASFILFVATAILFFLVFPRKNGLGTMEFVSDVFLASVSVIALFVIKFRICFSIK